MKKMSISTQLATEMKKYQKKLKEKVGCSLIRKVTDFESVLKVIDLILCESEVPQDPFIDTVGKQVLIVPQLFRISRVG